MCRLSVVVHAPCNHTLLGSVLTESLRTRELSYRVVRATCASLTHLTSSSPPHVVFRGVMIWPCVHCFITGDLIPVKDASMSELPYYEKHVFSGLYIYKLVFPEPANSQNEENKWFLHGLCNPPTGKTVLLQAVHRPPLYNDRSYPRGGCPSPRWSSVCPAVS